jgi:hypothetical protein
MKKAFRANNLKPSTLEIIELANEVIEEWRSEYGFENMTARQIYYQFIGQDLFPESWIDREYNRKNGLDSETKNTQKNYKKLCVMLTDGRYVGMIDWDSMIDETRDLEKLPTWDSPADILSAVAYQYKTDVWANQTYRPEVWIEKDAAQIVLRPTCNEFLVPHSSCRGYGSSSAFKVAAERLEGYADEGQTPIILHVGDHDPSGKDMTRDIQDRLEEFLGFDLEVRRLALNMDQIRRYNPPPNPAKVSDPRAKEYVREFGDDSWELDALRPNVLTALVRNEIESLIDSEEWEDSQEEYQAEKAELNALHKNWSAVSDFLKSR